MKSNHYSPIIMVLLLALTVSARLLSDPDLGTHLNGGRWIAEHHAVPQKDFSTYTVRGNDYTDIYWSFQLLLYGLYSIGGYKTLSLLVTVMSLLLFLLLYTRNNRENIHPGITASLLLTAFLVIEPRLVLRPELFTFIYLTLVLIVLDQYVAGKREILWLLPLIMIAWCNLQGLYVLGLLVITVYFVSQSLANRKPDRKLGLFLLVSALVCLVNPYFARGFLFPFELFTRLEGENIFHQHIRELTSVTSLDKLFFKDVLFLAWIVLALLSVILTASRKKLYEWVLVLAFLYLALTSVRNIPLFVLVSFPVVSRSLNSMMDDLREGRLKSYLPVAGKLAFWGCIIIPVLIIPRMITNEYYHSNSTNSKTGLGIDQWYQPVRAAEFMHNKELKGRMINSLAFGGWLSWSLQQPVFIDGRLEVIKEPLYLEVVDSWSGKLQGLVDKYKPEIIVYNYLKYYPWTVQLQRMQGWKLVYLDGFTAIYAVNGIDGKGLEFTADDGISGSKRDEILNKIPVGRLADWLDGFYKTTDNRADEKLNMASFCLQAGLTAQSETFFLQYLEMSRRPANSVYYALADIYRSMKLYEPAQTCYRKILSFDPGNQAVKEALGETTLPVNAQSPSTNGSALPDQAAIKFYNQGNDFFQRGEADKALAAYNEALKLCPGYIKALNNRGIVEASSFQKFREAIADFNEVIRLDPSNADAWLGRGSCLFQLNVKDSACRDWVKASELGNKGAGVLLERNCGRQGKK
ncbi:MAG: tetratricopeptide repeat protein [Bacteroidota bacterium]